MTKEELINAISGLPVETQVYKIDDYADLDRSDGCPLLGVIVVNEPDSKPDVYSRLKKLLPSTVAGAIVLLTGGSYILYATFKRKNFLTILKNKERVRTMTKKNVNDK